MSKKKPKLVRKGSVDYAKATPLELATGAVKVVVSEKEMELACDRLAADMGAKTVKFSQPRESMQTEGIADRRYRYRGRAFWFEVKAEDGKLSEDQLHFLTEEYSHGALVGAGGRDELLRLLSAPTWELARIGWETVNAVAARGVTRSKKQRSNGSRVQRRDKPSSLRRRTPERSPAH